MGANVVTEKVEKHCHRCGAAFTLDVPLPPDEGASGPEATAVRFARTLADHLICADCAEADATKEAQAKDAQTFAVHMAASGMPPDLRRALFADFKTTTQTAPARDAAREWGFRDQPRGLFLFGPVGRGKTHLAAAAAAERMHRHPVTWCSVVQLLSTLKGPFGDQERAKALGQIRGRGALVLDDLDKAAPTDFAVEQIFAVIDARVAAGAPLIVTSNLRPSQIGESYGEPIMSRLSGYCRRFELDGPDHRITAVAA